MSLSMGISIECLTVFILTQEEGKGCDLALLPHKMRRNGKEEDYQLYMKNFWLCVLRITNMGLGGGGACL